MLILLVGVVQPRSQFFFEDEISVHFVEQFIFYLWVNTLRFHYEDQSVNSVQVGNISLVLRIVEMIFCEFVNAKSNSSYCCHWRYKKLVHISFTSFIVIIIIIIIIIISVLVPLCCFYFIIMFILFFLIENLYDNTKMGPRKVVGYVRCITLTLKSSVK
jgi:hypothetical protein